MTFKLDKINISYLIILVIAFISIRYELVSLVFMMTLSYILIKKLNLFFAKFSKRLSYYKIFTKTISILIIAIVLFCILFGLNYSFSFLYNNYSLILEKFNILIGELISYLPSSFNNILNIDFKAKFIHILAEQQESLYHMTLNIFHFISNCVIGIFLGIVLAFNHVDNKIKSHEKLSEINSRFKSFLDIFEKIFLGQGKISLINTAFTGVYLFIILPCFGYYIPHSQYLLFFTFIFGLLPIVGNIFSNTLILIFSISLNIKIVISSMLFLVIVHKLEYYVNGMVLGKKTNMNLFETIISMVLFESMLGLTGLFLGTLIYAYIKSELINLKLI